MNIRTLFIVKEIPYPPIGGVCLRNWQNINIMKKYGEVGVFAIDNKYINVNSLPNVDFFHYHNLNSVNSTLENGNQLIDDSSPFYCQYTKNAYTKAAGEILNNIMQDFQPDLVIIEQLWLSIYMEIIKNYPCKVVLDNHNIEADLLVNKGGNSVSEAEIKQVELVEKHTIINSDQVWLCSNKDQELLKAKYGQFNHINLVPNAINLDAYTFDKQTKIKENKIIYSGYFPYEPNQFAAELLIKEIFPGLQAKYPESCLMLVGYKPTEFMLNAAKNNSKIIVTGEVADVKPYFQQANIMVVPLFQGGGTRLKILEAFASGCPVVSTSKGAEGLIINDGEHLLLADNISDIINAVDQIWSDAALSQKLAYSAYSLVNAAYSWQAVAQNIEYAIKQLFML